MYFPKLFNLITDKNFSNYSGDIVTKIDDYLGLLKQGTCFNESDFNITINDVLLTDQILKDLIKLEIIEESDEETFIESSTADLGDQDKKFVLLIEPNKLEDKNYQEYIKRKRYIDSFSIIYEKTKNKNSGALTLIDLKGYSKNVNNENTNPTVLSLIDKLQNIITDSLNPYFLNRYSGIEIKHNGDGWFLYFLNENEAYEFLEQVLISCKSNENIQTNFKSLNTSLKCYIHHAKEIEKIYKVDTLHFDMEGKDVILIHMLEKPIEKALYEGIISKDSNFIAITETVFAKIDLKYVDLFHELKNLIIDIKDVDGNNKVTQSDIKVYYQEYK